MIYDPRNEDLDRQAMLAQLGQQVQTPYAPQPGAPQPGGMAPQRSAPQAPAYSRPRPASAPVTGQAVPRVEPPAPAAPTPPPAAGGGDYQQQFRDIMGQYGYGASALGDAEEALKAAGFQMQRDSAGQARGRIRLPDGRLVDVHGLNEGITEQDNWFNNPRGTDWGWQDRGMHPLGDAGWSFDGVGYGGGQAPAPAAGAPGASGFADVTGALTDRSFFEELLAAARQEAGQGGDFSREALLALLGRQ
jgi:hypothetical protein